MKAKKVMAVLLAVSMVVGMAAGCGKKKESGSSKSEDGVTEPDVLQRGPSGR